MKSLNLGLLIILVFIGKVQAADIPPAKAPALKQPTTKSQYNTQVYEKDADGETSFEAVVKLVREVQGDTEVFFEGKNGLYVLSSSSGHNFLVQSQKKKVPVSVQINPATRQILKVDLIMNAATNSED